MIRFVLLAPTYQRGRDWQQHNRVNPHEVLILTDDSRPDSLVGMRFDLSDSPKVLDMGGGPWWAWDMLKRSGWKGPTVHGTWQEPELFDQATACPRCGRAYGDDVTSGDSWPYCECEDV